MKHVLKGWCMVVALNSLCTVSLLAQSISGVINTYAKVNSIPLCNPCSGACNQLVVSSAAGFAVADKVLIIQMKGASLNTLNAATFGSVSNYGTAGAYEFAVISGITGTTITFTSGLKNTYDATGAVQMVKVPQYTTVTVTGLLTAPVWNGSTGGVLAFEASGAVTLNAAIQVNGTGFRGGASATNGFSYPCGLTDYFYAGPTFDNGAPKGEGLTDTLSGMGLGKGAWSNGGGGGNSHNGGGGGGSNAGSGGNGGNDYCSGTVASGGVGGYVLNTFANTRAYFGGGGGGGHQNDTYGTPGGNGGGIIMIKAAQLIGNSFAIQANGVNALNTTGGGNDGAGGGGGGGTILLDVPLFTGTLSVNANGGKGGDMTNTGGGHAPGGGAGGGRVCFTSATVPAAVTRTVTGGASGIITASLLSFGATAGADGVINFSCPYSLPAGPKKISASLGSDVVLCDPISATLDASVSGPWYTYVWYKDGSVITGANTSTYPVTAAGTYVVDVSSAGCLDGRDTIQITTKTGVPNDAFFCAPPAQVVPLSVTGTGKYKWYTSGGVAVAKGSSYSPTLSATTTYYVQDTSSFSYGNFTPSAMLTSFNQRGGASNTYMSFDAVKTFTLDSVSMFIRTYNTNTDNLVINLMQKGNATPLATKSLLVTGPCNCTTDREVQFYLGFTIPPGNDYYLAYASGSVNVHWDGSGAAYPYQVPGIVSIKQPVDGSGNLLSWAPTSYGFFYNWKISSGILCQKIPVKATLSCVLPLSLLYIDASQKNENALIRYSIDNRPDGLASCYLERSYDGHTFVSLPSSRTDLSLLPKGMVHLEYVDTPDYTATVYYRLVMTDDGETSYSRVVALARQDEDELVVFPNPFHQQIFIKSLSDLSIWSYAVYSIDGKSILSKTAVPSDGIITLDEGTAEGMYLIYLYSDRRTMVFKLLKAQQ